MSISAPSIHETPPAKGPLGPKVLVAVHRDLRKPLLDNFWRRLGDAVTILPLPESSPLSSEEIEEYLGDADILVTSWLTPPLPSALPQIAPRLRLICHAAGSVRPLTSRWTPTGDIRLASAAEALGQGVGEFAFTMALTAAKGVPWYADSLRNGGWKERPSAFCEPFEMEGEPVGIIGLGYSARWFASMAMRAGARVFAYDPFCPQDLFGATGVEQVSSIETLFEQCRVISLHAASLPENRGMINATHFALMRQGAIFINTARADLVNEADLIKAAAENRTIFCLDVTWREPLEAAHPLRAMPNVLLTPHIAGASHENRRRIGSLVADQIHAYLKGVSIPGEIRPHHFAYLA